RSHAIIASTIAHARAHRPTSTLYIPELVTETCVGWVTPRPGCCKNVRTTRQGVNYEAPMKSVVVLTLPIALTVSLAVARNPSTLREVRDTVADALDAARDADKACREDVLDLIKDANRAARDLRAGDRRATADLERMLERAVRRAKESCGKQVVRALDDALDAIDALPHDGGGAPKAYEPTMQDVTNATNECAKQDRYQGD